MKIKTKVPKITHQPGQLQPYVRPQASRSGMSQVREDCLDRTMSETGTPKSMLFANLKSLRQVVEKIEPKAERDYAIWLVEASISWEPLIFYDRDAWNVQAVRS